MANLYQQTPLQGIFQNTHLHTKRLFCGVAHRQILLTLCLFSLLCTSLPSLASESSGWLRTNAQIPPKGATEWTAIVTTGHFGNDPQLAQATRQEILSILFSVGSTEDKVRLISAESKVWGQSEAVSLSQLASVLPISPAPNSKGGYDIENLLAQSAPNAKGPILVFSPSDSQLPIDGSGELKGGDGSVAGFNPPQRIYPFINTPNGSRQIRITLLTKAGLFQGENMRQPLPNPPAVTTPKPTKTPPNTPPPPPVTASQPPWGVLIGGGILFLLVGYGIGFSHKKAFSTDIPSPSQTSPQNEEFNEVLNEGLDVWKTEASKQNRRLSILIEEFSELMREQNSSDTANSTELRQEIARSQKTVDVWDEVAITYHDGILRALSHPELSADYRQALEQLSTQFIRLIQRTGLDIIAPVQGDPMLDGLHKIEEVVPPTATSPTGTVAGLFTPGYRRGERVIRLATIQYSGEQNR